MRRIKKLLPLFSAVLATISQQPDSSSICTEAVASASAEW